MFLYFVKWFDSMLSVVRDVELFVGDENGCKIVKMGVESCL